MWDFTPNIAGKFQELFKEVTTNIIKVCQCEETKQLPCFSAIVVLTRNSNTRGTKIPLKRAQCGLHKDHELCQWPLNPFISQLTPSKRWLALGEKESLCDYTRPIWIIQNNLISKYLTLTTTAKPPLLCNITKLLKIPVNFRHLWGAIILPTVDT